MTLWRPPPSAIDPRSYHHGHQDHRSGHHVHGHHDKKHGHLHAGAADGIADRLLPDGPKTTDKKTTDKFHDFNDFNEAPGLLPGPTGSPFLTPSSSAGDGGDVPLMPRSGATPTRPRPKPSDGPPTGLETVATVAGLGSGSGSGGGGGKPPRYISAGSRCRLPSDTALPHTHTFGGIDHPALT